MSAKKQGDPVRIVEFRGKAIKALKAVTIRPGNKSLVKLTGKNRQGKQAPITEPILTPGGWFPIGNVEVGDMVIGRSGFPVRVTGVYPQASRKVFRVTMADGGNTRCGPDHLWTVGHWKNSVWTYGTFTTNTLLGRGVWMNAASSRRWAIPLPDPITFRNQDETLPIDPYVLGVLLGDAHIADTGYVQLTTDTEIINRIGIDGYREEHRSKGIEAFGSGHWSFRLKALGLAGMRSQNKFVPEQYLWASVEERKAILSGLLDTDGYATGRITGAIEFTSTSEELASDVVHLVRSLGGIASKGEPVTKKYTYCGEKREGQPAYRVRIKLPYNPFTLSRKADAWEQDEDIKEAKRFIDSIEPCPDEDCVCISVDAEDGLYITKDYIVTHNTSVLDAIWMALGGRACIPSKPIKDGEAEGEAFLDLGEFSVTRKITATGEYLHVQTANGFKASKPQEFLNSKLGSRARNPLEFMRLKPDEQVRALQNMVKLEVDPDLFGKITGLQTRGINFAENPVGILDGAYKHLYERRAEANKEVKRLDESLKTVKQQLPPGTEAVSPVSVQELFAERLKLEAVQKANDEQRGMLEREDIKLADLGEHAASIDKQITDLQNKITILQRDRGALVAQYQEMEGKLSGMSLAVEQLVDPDFTEIDTRIAGADEANRLANLIKSKADLEAAAETAKTESLGITSKMDALKDYKLSCIQAAGLPIAGLGFENGEVTFNGIPLSQASGREQIEISCAICAAENPEIGILTVDIGYAELDKDGQAALEEFARAKNLQIWCTKVAEEPEADGFHIYSGELVAVDGVPVGTEPAADMETEKDLTPVQAPEEMERPSWLA